MRTPSSKFGLEFYTISSRLTEHVELTPPCYQDNIFYYRRNWLHVTCTAEKLNYILVENDFLIFQKNSTYAIASPHDSP